MTSHTRDGFDGYVSTSNMTDAGGKWTTVSSVNLSSTTRFANGQALLMSSTGGDILVPRATSTNESTWFATLAFIQTTALGGATQGPGIQLTDGASTQCGFWFRSDGAIVFRNGGSGGTVLATFAGAFAAGSYDHYQVKIIVDNTAGEIHVRKNGATSDTFSATGLDTTTTANNYANSFKGNVGGNYLGNTGVIDDLWVYNGNTASYPFDWIGDTRAYQTSVALDTAQLQFSRSATGTNLVLGSTAVTGTQAITAGNIYIHGSAGTTVTQGGYLTSAVANFNAGFTGNARVGIYAGDGNVTGFSTGSLPGTLVVAQSNTLNNPTSGNNTFTFPSNVPIMKGWNYYLALQTDTNCTMQANTSGSGVAVYSGTFAAGLPLSVIGAPIIASVRLTMSATVVPNNAGCTNDFQSDDATTYVYDNVVGHYDQSTINPLNYTPSIIHGVDFIARVAKSDAGGRGSKIALTSGGNLSYSSEYNPLTTYSWQIMAQDTDPATGSQWNRTSLEALTVGPLVSS